MTEHTTPGWFVTQLIEKMSAAEITEQTEFRRRALYDLRDNTRARLLVKDGRYWFASEDSRYIILDRLCREHGLEGFLQIAEATQKAQLLADAQLKPINFTLLYEPQEDFRRALTRSGAFNDSRVMNLYHELSLRLAELRRKQSSTG